MGRKGASLEQHLNALKRLGGQLGRAPTAREIDACPYTASAATYVRRFGSLPQATGQAGLKSAQVEQGPSTEDMIRHGIELAQRLGRLPGWNDWTAACQENPDMPSQWQVYRRFGGEKGSWDLFAYQVFATASDLGIALDA